jgi:hypothetical protein
VALRQRRVPAAGGGAVGQREAKKALHKLPAAGSWLSRRWKEDMHILELDMYIYILETEVLVITKKF